MKNKNISISPSHRSTQGKISKLSLLSVTAHLLHHNRCLFLWTWCWRDT